MNRIENEQIKFYFEHEERIREWANLETEVIKFVDRFYRSLKSDLDAALSDGRISDDDCRVVLVGESWPGVGLRRRGWPKGDDDPVVRFEWSRKSAHFPPHGWLICGVRTNVNDYRPPFAKEARPGFPRQTPYWPAFKNLEPPVGRFWESDNLKEYRNHLVETILQAWRDLAPLVDEAVGLRSDSSGSTP
ncbi:MAG: hypothetical protein OXI18_12925 [bacterium]|nr:hypothetical protein [bacterium]